MTQMDRTVFEEFFKGVKGRLVLVALAVLVINIIASIYVVSPLAETEGALKARIERLESDTTATATTEDEGVGGVQRTYDDIKSFRERLLSEKELTATVSKVFKAATGQGLTIKNSAYSPGKPNAFGISRYTVSFPVSGVYGKIKKFIHDLESMKTPLAVEELALSRSTKGNQIELNVTLSAYFIR